MTFNDLKDRIADFARQRDDVLRRTPLHRRNAYAFFGTLFLGLLFISIFDPSDFAQTSILLIYLIGMFIIMGIYVVFCLYYMRRMPGAEDYVYYMGFLFTLIGLALSLVKITKITETGNTKIIVGYFGVALTSTIIGVAYRVLLIQTHRDLEPTMEGELNNAADSARNLTDELKATNLAFSNLRKQTEKAAARLGTKMVSDTEAMSQELQAILKDLSEQSARQMGETTRALAETSGKVQHELQTTSALLRDQMVGHAQQFSDKMAAAADAIPQQVNAVFGRVGERWRPQLGGLPRTSLPRRTRCRTNCRRSQRGSAKRPNRVSARSHVRWERSLGRSPRELQKVYDDLRSQTERQAAEIAAAMMAQTSPCRTACARSPSTCPASAGTSAMKATQSHRASKGLTVRLPPRERVSSSCAAPAS